MTIPFRSKLPQSSPESTLLLVNQTIGPLFADIITAAASYGSVYVFQGLPYRRSPSVARLLTWFVFTIQLALHLIFKGNRYSRVLVVSNPPFAPLLAFLSRKPYSLLLYDLYPQVLCQITPRSALQRYALSLITYFWHTANHLVFPRAERLFTLSAPMADHLKRYFPNEELWHQHVVVIPPWADNKHMSPRPDQAKAFRQLHDLSGLLVTYSGNMGLTHPLESLVEAARLLDDSNPSSQIQILFIGHGAKRNALEHHSRQLKLPITRLRFLDTLPYPQLPASLSAADIYVVALDGAASSTSLPSKTFNALACGTPLLVLAPSTSALSQLVHLHKCGVVIEPGPNAPYQLADAMHYFLSNPEELQQLANNAFQASLYYTPANAIRLLEAWLGRTPYVSLD